jgi:hypothetical protein
MILRIGGRKSRKKFAKNNSTSQYGQKKQAGAVRDDRNIFQNFMKVTEYAHY